MQLHKLFCYRAILSVNNLFIIFFLPVTFSELTLFEVCDVVIVKSSVLPVFYRDYIYSPLQSGNQ